MEKLISPSGALQVMPDKFLTGISILNFAGNAESGQQEKKTNMPENVQNAN